MTSSNYSEPYEPENEFESPFLNEDFFTHEAAAQASQNWESRHSTFSKVESPFLDESELWQRPSAEFQDEHEHYDYSDSDNETEFEEEFEEEDAIQFWNEEEARAELWADPEAGLEPEVVWERLNDPRQLAGSSTRRQIGVLQESLTPPNWVRIMNLPQAYSPTDSLKRVSDTEAAPFRYICQITALVGSNDVEISTGVLVGARHILTTAHSLVEGGRLINPDNVSVYPALNKSDVPFESSNIARIITSPGFTPGDEVTPNDFALLETKRDFSKEPGFWGTPKNKFDSRGSVVGEISGWQPGRYKLNVSGYPNNVSALSTWDGQTQWHCYDDTVELSKGDFSSLSRGEQRNFLFFKNNIQPGMSGSPLWVTRNHNLGGRFAFAIVLGIKEINGRQFSVGRLIDRDVTSFIRKHTKKNLRKTPRREVNDYAISNESRNIDSQIHLYGAENFSGSLDIDHSEELAFEAFDDFSGRLILDELNAGSNLPNGDLSESNQDGPSEGDHEMTELELEDSFIGFEIEDTYDTELDEEEYTIEDQLQLQALTSIEFEETEFEEGSGINFNVPYESEFPATNEPKPGRFYKIQYGKGGLLTTAQRAYKTKSKAERLKRAQQINNHPLNRKFWRKPDNSFEKKSFSRGIIRFSPAFTCNEEQRLARKGEKKCFATIWIPVEETYTHPTLGRAVDLPESVLFALLKPNDNILSAELETFQNETALSTMQAEMQEEIQEEMQEEIQEKRELRKVSKPNLAPSRFICSLVVTVSHPTRQGVALTFGPASGTLIGFRHVLTAAHVLSNDWVIADGRFKAEMVIVTPMHHSLRKPPKSYADDTDTNLINALMLSQRSLGSFAASSYKVHPQFNPSGSSVFDIGLIKLADSVGSLPWAGGKFGYWGSSRWGNGTLLGATAERSFLNKESVCVSGYPTSKLSNHGINQWQGCGSVDNADLPPGSKAIKNGWMRLGYQIKTEDGHSGSPVWLTFKNQGKTFRKLVAVHSDGGSGIQASSGVLITPTVLEWIRKSR